jgi:phosphoserine aminotransferase
MDEPDLERLGRAYSRAKDKADSLHAELKQAVIDAYRAGVGTMEISHRTGQGRELIRRIRVAAEKAGQLPTERDT